MKNAEQTPLRILHLEDDPRDAELVRSLLEQEGITCQMVCVSTRSEYEEALRQNSFDLVLSDNSLPSFNGKDALELTQQWAPTLPFIFVTGSIGEEAAIETMTGRASGSAPPRHSAQA